MRPIQRFRTPLLSCLALALCSATITTANAQTRLSFTASQTPTAPSSLILEKWAEQLKKDSGGELEVEFYWQQSLSKLTNNLKAVASGLADMGVIIPAYSRKNLPLAYLSSTSSGSGNQYVVYKAWLDTRAKFPGIHAEEDENNLVFLTASSIGPVTLVGDKPYPTPAALAGATMRLSSHFTFGAKSAKWDVNPVRISSPETYTALEKGTISGSTNYLYQIYAMRLNEVVKHATILDLGQHMNQYYINKDSWKKLTDKQRKVISNSLPQLGLDLARDDLEDSAKVLERMPKDPKYPVQVYVATDAEQAVWEKALAPSYDNNIKKAAAVNDKAPEIGAFFLSQIKANSAAVKAGGYPWAK